MSNNQIKHPFGLRGNKLVSVSEVPRGRACECKCPNRVCGAPLEAVKGQQRQHYFRHYNRPECPGGVETAIHLKAKQLLIEKKQIKLPAYVIDQTRCDSKGMVHTFSKKFVEEGLEVSFDTVEAEIQIQDIRPDILAMLKDRKLIIEIFYSNKVSEEKMEKIKSLGISAIEIDLSRIKQEDVLNSEVFWLYMNDIANIHWLNYALKKDEQDKIDMEVSSLVTSQENIYKIKEEEQETIRKRDKEKFERALNDIGRIMNKEYISKLTQNGDQHHAWLNFGQKLNYKWLELPEFVRLEVVNGGWIFGCDKRVWQSAVFWRFVQNSSSPFHLKSVYPWLRDQGKCRVPACAVEVSKNLNIFSSITPKELIDFPPYYWATLAEYFNYLCHKGILRPLKEKDWYKPCGKT